MSFCPNRENSSEWTFLQESYHLPQIVKSPYTEKGQVEKFASPKAPTNEEPGKLFDSGVCIPISCEKKNDQKYQSICSILDKSKSLPYAQRPRDPEKFLAMHIVSNKHISKEQLKHLDLLAKPKYVAKGSLRLRPSQSRQLQNYGSYAMKLPHYSKSEKFMEPKSVASVSMRLQNLANYKNPSIDYHSNSESWPPTKQMKQCQPSVDLLKLASCKPYSPNVVDPFEVSLFTSKNNK